MPDDTSSRHDRWARLRFAIIGPLLAAPPRRGQRDAALRALAAQTWRHPLTEQPVGFGFSTIERLRRSPESDHLRLAGVTQGRNGEREGIWNEIRNRAWSSPATPEMRTTRERPRRERREPEG